MDSVKNAVSRKLKRIIVNRNAQEVSVMKLLVFFCFIVLKGKADVDDH